MKTFLRSFQSLFFFLGALAVLSACESKKANTEEKGETVDIVGKWDVQWVTTPDESAQVSPDTNYTMNGVFDIKKDGKITISAYGYENCIFGKDTLVHTLQWEMYGDTLNVKNKGDEFGMPYKILQATSDRVKLQLVEDVFLILSK
ncbi:hypothetical protein [Reichenbachiella ulvae]|uniref:Lipocalin-like domain-containing protein n=1 Tax=Reichenbachiella ulvae TaxID=2980104 RepID=A0ABT3CX33_9BACT|nr:hypothetical protein [Reichenbachiella ulvae]MCV9388257.1 hypothetical protein [Reichenbachiella ulvae]